MSAAPTLPPDYREPVQPPRVPRPRRARWKRVLIGIAAAIAVICVLLVIAVAVLLHSSRAHRYILRVAQQKATAALGSQVQARDFNLRLSGFSPTIDLYNVIVHGAPPHPDPPLLVADHIRVGATVTSLLHRKWYLNDVAVDHPVVRVLVDKNGTDNLPQTKSNNQSQSKTNLFDLGVRHAVLDRGEVYYNNRKSVMDADLHDLDFRAGFDPSATRYSGTLSYRDGHLVMENFRPIPHDLDAEFDYTPSAFTLKRAALRSGTSQFTLSATAEDLAANPRVRATYDATLNTAEFRSIMRNPSLPVGVLRLAGNLQYQSQPNVPALQVVQLTGNLSSAVLRVQTPSFRGDIRDIGARYSVNKGNLDVRDLRARLLGGELTGTMTIRDLTGASRSQLRAALRGVSLADLKSMMNSPALQKVALTGGVDATADATWGKTFNDLVARADATLNARLAPTTAAANAVPLNGVIHARYAAPAKLITLTDSYVRTPQTSLTLNGTVSNRSALQVQLRSSDLHELETVADMFQTPGQQTTPLGLYGTAAFSGAVRGTTAAPQLSGQLTANNLRIRGTSWKLLRTNLAASPSGVSLQNGVAQPADRGNIRFNISAGLRRWSFTDTSPIQVNLNATQLNAADLTRAAGVTTPIMGTLNTNVAIHGTERNLVGQGTVSLTNAKVSGETVNALNVKFQGTGNEVRANLGLNMPAGNAQGNVTYFPRQQAYDAQLQATGIRLDQLQTIKARGMDITGVLNLTASGRGTINNPALQASVQIPQLKAHGQTISDINLQTTVANHVANIALNSALVNTAVRANGTVRLTGDYYADATFDTQAIPLQPLVAIYSPAQAPNITGQTELHGTLRGPLKNKQLLDAHITIPALAVNYKNAVHIAEASPIHIDYANGVLNLQRAAIRGTGTDVQMQGSIPVASNAPMSLLLLGTIDLKLAQLFNPDLTTGGQLRFDINSYGQRANPEVQGQVQIVNATFATGDMPLGLQNGNGVLTLTRNRLDITRFAGNVGGGTVTASGGVVYRPTMQFDLALAGKGIRMLYPAGMREALDLNLALTGTRDAALLRGLVRIDQLQFTPDFDLTDFAGQFGGTTSPPPQPGFAQNLKLDLQVQSAGGVNLVSRTLSLRANANLNLRGTADQPVVLGRVNLNGGDMIFNNNRYILQSGTIDFVNPVQTEPVVNVAVNTTIQQYNIHLRFDGPVERLHTTYTSDPALPPADIIHLLAFGSTTESAAANPLPGNLGAESMVASQVSSQITSRVEKIAGISQLSVDPLLGCNQQNRGACVTIKQRVTSNIFVTFSTDVTSMQNDTVQLQYQVTPRVSFSGTRDQNGGFGFDTKIRKTW